MIPSVRFLHEIIYNHTMIIFMVSTSTGSLVLLINLSPFLSALQRSLRTYKSYFLLLLTVYTSPPYTCWLVSPFLRHGVHSHLHNVVVALLRSSLSAGSSRPPTASDVGHWLLATSSFSKRVIPGLCHALLVSLTSNGTNLDIIHTPEIHRRSGSGRLQLRQYIAKLLLLPFSFYSCFFWEYSFISSLHNYVGFCF
jgi:hypothetical protein